MKGAKEVKVPQRTPTLVRLSDVKPEAVSWLWHPYIPQGKLTLLEGDPGLGKTFLALALAGLISKGEPFPGGGDDSAERREPADVIYLSAEDGVADTLRPRLDAVGADVSRIHALSGWTQTDDRGNTTTGAVNLADVPVLESAVQAVKPALVVIDPLQAYLGAGVDMHRANEVRPLLTALGDLAALHNFAVVCIRHLSKGSKDRAIYRGLGSIDFTAAARSMLLVGEHPQDEGARVVAHTKASLAEKGPSLGFRISDGAVFWTGVSDVSAEDMLGPRQSEEARSTVDEACEFLSTFLEEGPQLAKEVFQAGKEAGISERTLKRAKKQLGVESDRSSLGNDGQGGWVWALPPKEHTGTLAPLREKAVTDARLQEDHPKTLAPLPEQREGREKAQEVQGCQRLPLGEAGKHQNVDKVLKGGSDAEYF